jgi:hypothetical protein
MGDHRPEPKKALLSKAIQALKLSVPVSWLFPVLEMPNRISVRDPVR